ncbi:MBL fold metallo-hydrolase [Paraburkholderia caribensis]|uniref:MBL fold metallo-hydrolase n=1 Tax=Paraburkholderia caribensis TaxID=75105 RepID=UPI0009EF0438|nr:MBL fold metallo-hydrolase [Paraburkholderia caribensis]
MSALATFESLPDRAYEVLHLPAHSPGSIGLWDVTTGTQFPGDAIYDGPLLDDIDGVDVSEYIRTLNRLRELPINVVHAGHNGSFGRKRLVQLVDIYLSKRTYLRCSLSAISREGLHCAHG